VHAATEKVCKQPVNKDMIASIDVHVLEIMSDSRISLHIICLAVVLHQQALFVVGGLPYPIGKREVMGCVMQSCTCYPRHYERLTRNGLKTLYIGY
jgi:hypothetical protein